MRLSSEKNTKNITLLHQLNKSVIHLDGVVVVVRDVWQWGPVLAQCVVTGIGVVVVVTVRNICQAKHIVWCTYLNDNKKMHPLKAQTTVRYN